jgi:hypothetical protein
MIGRLVVIGAAAIGAYVVLRRTSAPRRRLTAALRRRLFRRMEGMMASLPEGSPPRLVMSVLPRLRDQNEHILALLRKQEGHRASAQEAEIARLRAALQGIMEEAAGHRRGDPAAHEAADAWAAAAGLASAALQHSVR